MSGSKFSTSRGRVIYVGDFLREFGPDALRYFIAVAGPETTDSDFTWDEFVRRTNFELANEWGNLVNRSISMAHKNNGAHPHARRRCSTSTGLCWITARGGVRDGRRAARPQPVQAAISEAMRVAGAANKYLSDTEPWKLGGDPGRRDTVLHTALQVVSDVNTLLTPVPAARRAEGARRPRRHRRLGGPAGGPGGQRGGRPRLPGDHGRRTPTSRPSGPPGRSPRVRRWSSRRRCSPSWTRPWARPARSGPRSRPERSVRAQL